MGKLKLFYFNHLVGEIFNLFIKPDPNYWLFSSSFNTSYNYNSKYLFEYMIKNNSDIKCRFVINDDKKRNKLTKRYGNYFVETKTLKGVKQALKAGVWVTSIGMPVYLLFAGSKRIIFNV